MTLEDAKKEIRLMRDLARKRSKECAERGLYYAAAAPQIEADALDDALDYICQVDALKGDTEE